MAGLGPGSAGDRLVRSPRAGSWRSARLITGAGWPPRVVGRCKLIVP
jgi:hypothetical protein